MNKKDQKNGKKKHRKNQEKENMVLKNRKLTITMLMIFLLFGALLARLFWLQFIDSSKLRELAYKQQTINRIISPKRGTIYDTTGKKLAISAPVDTVTINPTKIKAKTDEKTKELKESVASILSEIFELDYEKTYEKVTSTSSVETIAKKVEKDKIDTLKKWMQDNKVSTGINIDEDSKRYYPYNNLASQLIGVCGTDNQGLSGIELKWDHVLTGTPGKIVSASDAVLEEIPDKNQQYIAAENGSDLVLTIDYNVQSVVEKYLKQAVEENNCSRGGNAIIMNPNTGDILAMATYPDFNLNEPFVPNTEDLIKNWDTMEAKDRSDAIQQMWRNRAVSDGYDPGSTFKIITSSIALEEQITTTDKANDFNCIGYEEVLDREIKCWRSVPHGSQTLRQALGNSCNPAFMQLGARIGAKTMYQYYQGFGLFDKTGISTSGEISSQFYQLDTVGPVELATMSFGQRFTITPIQLITAICASVNDGTLMKPRLVKEIINTDTNVTTEIDPMEVRQVISKETSEKIRDMLSSVITDGTGGRAAVKGYTIGGKSGTSEPPQNKPEQGYVSSFIGVAPADNPELVILVILYDPHGDSHQGGTIAGPVVSQILTEILPYLGIASSDSEVSSSNHSDQYVTVPDIRNKTATEAEKILKSAGFTTSSPIKGDKNSILVTDQVPKPGTKLKKGAFIYLYSEEYNVRTSVSVPNLKGMSAAQATNSLKAKHLNISVEGSGIVITQDPAIDAKVEEGTVVNVVLKDASTDSY